MPSKECTMWFDWSLLNTLYNDIIQEVLSNWQSLVQTDSHEESLHSFLAEHAGLFFIRPYTYIVISKLRLGADYETDFVVTRDWWSAGLRYELVEIETPHKAPFNNKGNPSAYLSEAVQQIQSWKMWIRDNPQEVRRLFPAKDLAFDYTVVIGNRANTRQWLDRRNHYSRELGVSIRSFEYLSDLLLSNNFAWFSSLGGSEGREIPLGLRNAIANPFFSATTGRAWKHLLRDISVSGPHGFPVVAPSHFVPKYADAIIRHRRYNKYLRMFTQRYIADDRPSLSDFQALYEAMRPR